MRTIFESESIDHLGSYLVELGARRVLFLVSPRRRFVERALTSLSGLESAVFDGARVHVPRETVSAALGAADRLQADTVVALGGGAAVGLGKALCLQRELCFVVLATTYSGSEMTNIYGIREGDSKRTGRDERVRADLVLYDASLTTQLPVTLSLQSLANSMAQILSALSTDSVDQPADGLQTLAELHRLVQLLPKDPENLALRERALRAASQAGQVVDLGTMGAQHKLAHCLGGHFDLVHSSVHSVLLPSFLAELRRRGLPFLRSLDEATGTREFEAELYDALREHGAPLSLRELDVGASDLRRLLQAHPELPGDIAWDAYLGLRPCAGARIERSRGVATCIRFGPEPTEARRTIFALHGRGANAGRMLRDLRTIFEDASDLAFVVPQAAECRWYSKSYRRSLEEHGDEVPAALLHASSYLDQLTGAIAEGSVILFGFSQGACLALELVARRGGELGGVIAICGARIGLPDEQAAVQPLAGVPIVLGAAEEDSWLDISDIQRAADEFSSAGAVVQCLFGPGKVHEISEPQRARARELVG